MFATSVDQITEPEWNTLLGQFADASIYQTWAYGAVSWGEKQLSHLVLKRDGQPVALAQLRLVRIPIIGRGVAYLRWGPVCTPRGGECDPAVVRAATTAVVEEYVRRRRLLLRILPRAFQQDPAWPAIHSCWQSLGLSLEHSVKPYRTLRLDLAPPLETLRKQLDQKWRNQLNGAERNGLTLRQGTGDDLYQQFLELYEDMMARKRFDTTVDPHEFRRIQQRLPEGQKMPIFISVKDGRPMTALVGSIVGDMGIYLLGATSGDGMKTKGSYLLQWQMIQRLKEHGCRWYDLGGIDPEKNPGVYHFKQGMGGQDVSGPGRFALSSDPLSSAAVMAGERVKARLARLSSAKRAALPRPA